MTAQHACVATKQKSSWRPITPGVITPLMARSHIPEFWVHAVGRSSPLPTLVHCQGQFQFSSWTGECVCWFAVGGCSCSLASCPWLACTRHIRVPITNEPQRQRGPSIPSPLQKPCKFDQSQLTKWTDKKIPGRFLVIKHSSWPSCTVQETPTMYDRVWSPG
jgi:hypothetical protein